MRSFLSSRRQQSGFGLLEVLLAVGLTLLIGALSIDAIRTSGENHQAEAAGEQLKGVGQALNTYVAMRYDKIVTLTNIGGSCPDINNTTDITMQGDGNDPGPRCCTGSATDPDGALCTINSDTLRRNGLLPNSFSGYNSYGARYQYRIRVVANAPNYIVDGIVFTDQPYVTTGTAPRYDLLGTAMQIAGADSGMTRSVATRVEGLNGAWSETKYPDINKLGLLAYRVGYGTSGYAAYLRLDGSTAMTGDLQLGADTNTRHNITNVADINAKTATLIGTGTDNQAAMIMSNKNLGTTYFMPVTTGGEQGALSIQNAKGVDIADTAGGWGTLKAGTINAQTALTSNGYITANNYISAGGDITSTGGNLNVTTSGKGLILSGGGGWYMSDNTWVRSVGDKGVYTGGEMRAGTLTADGKLQVAGTASPNTACTNTAGYVSIVKSTAGNELLQCRNSLWTTLGTTSSVVMGAIVGNNATSTVVCPVGTAITGGGYSLINYAPVYPDATSNAPDRSAPSGNGWTIFTGGAPGNSTFRPYAVCAQ